MSHETSYLQHLRRKDAAVHSISEIQKDLTSHIRDIQEVKSTLEAVPCLPHSGALKTDALVQTLENKAILTLFSNQDALLAGIQSRLDRTIEILLAHAEELNTPGSPLVAHQEVVHELDTFVLDPLVHHPLKLRTIVDADGTTRNLAVNPSSYLPWDREFLLRHPPADCCLEQANCYATSWETETETWAPHLSYSGTRNERDGLINKFYCVLPPPHTVNPSLPDKSHAFDRAGYPFFKKLQVNDALYHPENHQFARALSWDATSCEVEITSIFDSAEAFWSSTLPRSRYEATWYWGSFVISLDQFDPQRRYLAYVSPYTREVSSPFKALPSRPVSSDG